MGVSKAAVSKWETESTYPDILLLPRLAAYFDMSIDELMVMNRRWTEKRSGRHTGCFQRSLPRILLRRLWSTAENTPGEYYSCYPLVVSGRLPDGESCDDGEDPGGRGTGDKGSGTAVPPRERRYR